MKKVLVVDDVKTDRDLIGKVVASVGYKPVYAADGDEALVVAKQESPALVFLDVVMPRMNGFNACRMLKTNPVTANIPVVLVTSKSADSDKFWGKRQGADGHITKPFSPEALEDMMKRFLK